MMFLFHHSDHAWSNAGLLGSLLGLGAVIANCSTYKLFNPSLQDTKSPGLCYVCAPECETEFEGLAALRKKTVAVSLQTSMCSELVQPVFFPAASAVCWVHGRALEEQAWRQDQLLHLFVGKVMFCK